MLSGRGLRFRVGFDVGFRVWERLGSMRERTAEDSQEAFGSAGPPACEARRTQGSTRASSKPGANTTGQIINAVSRRKASNMIK